MTILKAPAATLTDSAVELRLPSPDAGDIATIDRYVEDEQLQGGWLPEVPLVSGEQLVQDWLDCWHGHPSPRGAAFTFVVTIPHEHQFIGVVGVTEGDDGAFEMTYGTAPAWRGRGLASHATRLAAQWVARQPGVHTVETLIDQGENSSERVAVNAGFVLTDTMTRTDPDAGVIVQQRYVMQKPDSRPGR
jgi:RimJ/RimL family protein N-acetyltransferase